MEELNFSNWLLINGRHKNTIKQHLKRLKVLNLSKIEWSKTGVDLFLANLLQTRRNVTANHYIDTIRVYARFKGLNASLQNYPHMKKQPVYKAVFTDEEIERFLALECPRGCNKGVWELWQLFFECLAYLGARPGEVSALQCHHVDLGRNIVILEKTKTGVPRQLELAPNLRSKLEKRIAEIGSGYVFITNRGQRFSDRSWLHAFDKRKQLLGFTRPNLTPYSFRHSFCTNLLEQDVNLHKVAKIMGHDIKMTAQYEHLTVKDIRKAMQKHSLISRQLSHSPHDIAQLLKDVLDPLKLNYDLVVKDNSLLLKFTSPQNAL